MDEMRDALLRLVRAWVRTNTVLDAYMKTAGGNNMLEKTCGDMEEAICILLGERDKELEETVTHTALTAPYLSEERRVKMLMAKYEANHPAMPMPSVFEREDMKKSVKKNGGYLHETPEGGWA